MKGQFDRDNEIGNVHRYEDIIDLPHPVSKNHPQMSMENRAAQFAPFAALTGYEDVIAETGRITESRAEINEDRKEILNMKLGIVMGQLDGENEDNPEMEITYYVPDKLKDGGAYQRIRGEVKQIDTFKRVIVMEDGQEIFFDDIYDIDCL